MWNLLLPALATLGGAYISTTANTHAADVASHAVLQGAQIQADAIRQGNEQAQATLQQIRSETAPGGTYLRQVIADPGELTPQQAAQLVDMRRSVGNTIHSSNFAGSGRTGVALLKKSETDFTNEALQQNRNRADVAAGTMFNAGNSAAAGVAASQAGTGAAIGKAVGDATGKAGLYDAQAGLASGNVTGKAIGDIGALIATQGRESRYADRLSSIEKNLGLNRTM